MTKKCLCPVCYHYNEMCARLEGYTTDPIEIMSMRWIVPKKSMGYWRCEHCGFRGDPDHVGTLLDAVLMLSAPGCPTIEDGVHADARDAFDGGEP